MKIIQFISILAAGLLPVASFGQVQVGGVGGVVPEGDERAYVFNKNGVAREYTLSVTELGSKDDKGKLVVSKDAGAGSKTAVMQKAAQEEPEFLVFYPKGREGVESERLLLRNRFLVKLRPGADLQDLCKRRKIPTAEMKFAKANLAVCEEASPARVLEQIAVLSKDGAVVSVEPLFARMRSKRAIPNDPLFPDQWHLSNTGQNGAFPGIDVNVEAAWDQVTGAGVTVSIVDDGLYTLHEDLVDNVDNDLGHSWNNFFSPDDPSPTSTFDDHGTAVAGVVGASWNNDTGGAGVAPGVALAGLQLIAGPVDDEEESEAIGWRTDVIDVSNNSWGPTDFITDFEDPGPLTLAAFQDGVENGRDGLGVIYVWSGGNGAESNDNSNYDGYANSPYTIAVGACTDKGLRAPYSELGANLVVVAPSDGGNQDITTTAFLVNPEPPEDPADDPFLSAYVDDFGGTSAAVPAVSGVAALMLEANPQLGWRDVQEILMTTAVEIDSESGGWYTNAAGLGFNHEFGAGLVDAEAAVNLAQTWTNLEPVQKQERQILPTEFMPDGDGNSYVATFDLSDATNFRVEHVELQTTIITQSRSELQISLISPNGTQSVLATPHTNSDEQSISNWSFMTVRNWGEGSAGVWVVRVTDVSPGNQGFFNNALLRIHGVPDENAPVSQAPLLISDRLVSGFQNSPLVYRLEVIGGDSISVGTLPAGLTYNPGTGIISGVPTEAGVVVTPITITVGDIDTVENVVFSIEPLAFSLGEALEQALRMTTTAGEPWQFEFAETSDGVSALGSAPGLGDNLSSSVGFGQVAEGVVMFDWRVDSEPGRDRLWFSIGSELPPYNWTAFISGAGNWGRVAAPMYGTTNDLWWTYSKDRENSVGRDRGYLDQVAFMDMRDYLEDLKEAGSVNFDFAMKSRTFWMPVEDDSRPDGFSMQSSRIGNGQTVSMSAWVEGPAQLSFAYKTQTGAGDALEVIANSLLLESHTGDNDWTISDLPILPPGPNYVEIRYRRGFAGGSGVDIVNLDDVNVRPVTSYEYFVTQNFTLAQQLNPLISGPDADPDTDGFTNFEEYAFIGDPLVPDRPTYIPTLRSDDSGQRWIEFGFNTSATDLAYKVEQSGDLENWDQSLMAMYDRTENHVDIFKIAIGPDMDPAAAYFRVVATSEEGGGVTF